MPSPINQAKLQEILLRAVLNDIAPEVLGKMLGLQFRFGGMLYDAYAAVSDNGIINWPPTDKYETICKADGICALIRERLAIYKSRAGVLGFSKGVFRHMNPNYSLITYSDETMLKVAQNLVARHLPLAASTKTPAAAQPLTSKVLVLPENTPPNPTLVSTSACWDCSAGLSQRVMDFCRAYSNRFDGGLYCMKCQPKY